MDISTTDILAWLGVAVVGIIWLVARKGRTVRLTEERNRARELQRIIGEWGAFLESNRHSPNTICDERELPFDKTVLKNAIFEVLKNGIGDRSKDDAIASSLVYLAQYQRGVGAPLIHPIESSTQNIAQEEFQSRNDSDLHSVAIEITAAAKDPRYEEFNRLVEAEINDSIAKVRQLTHR